LTGTDSAVFTIEVKVTGRFRQLVSQPHFPFEVRGGDTVQTLIGQLGLPSDAPDLWVLVDHVPARRDHSLKPGEVVTFFQPIAGG
jgi:molybdopterin converting factor small subunit